MPTKAKPIKKDIVQAIIRGLMRSMVLLMIQPINGLIANIGIKVAGKLKIKTIILNINGVFKMESDKATLQLINALMTRPFVQFMTSFFVNGVIKATEKIIPSLMTNILN
jgi:hypothetical protein